MAYTSSSVSYSDLQEPTSASSDIATSNPCCSKASADLKLYQAFIFSIPIFFTFILLSLFYLFYLRRRRVDWSSIRMRSNHSSTFHSSESDDTSRAELGLKKEVREMLPIIVFKESFSVKDPQCSVCLGDYEAEEKLQQIPACGHTFHMDCIDHWLSTRATCPLCRHSILISSPTKVPSESIPDIQSVREDDGSLHPQNSEETSSETDPSHCEDYNYCRQQGGMTSQNLVERIPIPTIHEEQQQEEEETTSQNVSMHL